LLNRPLARPLYFSWRYQGMLITMMR
jgi:hypothetical protein